MLSLEKKFTYCDDCPYFEPEIIKKSLYDTRNKDTIIVCERRAICEVIARGIASRNGIIIK